ncbi:hypothetical protein DFQ27_005057, partial [Actinomortierella ambigua]
MSFESEIRKDTNPTPTRFLMECGAFTPGLGLTLEPYNPFETSYKFLQSGTPKGESDLFGTSCKPNPTEPIYHTQHQSQDKQHSWIGYHHSDVHMDHEHEHESSPGLASPSSTPSPSSSSLQSPTSPLSLHFRKSSVDVHLSHPDHFLNDPCPVEYPTFIDKTDLLLMRSTFMVDTNVDSSTSPTSLVPADLHRFTPPPSDATLNSPEHQMFSNEEEDQEELDERNTTQMQLDHVRRYRKRHDSGMELNEAEARELAAQQQKKERTIKESASSPLSTVEERTTDISMAEDDEPAQAPVTRSRANPRSTKSASGNGASRTKSAAATTLTTNSSRSKSGATPKATKTVNAGKASAKVSSSKASNVSGGGGKGGQNKKQLAEEEAPDVKRQRFLERNRLAASKCREKKRLQTLKTIADADVITIRNQELHDQLNDLQEQVRSLKTQILCHRDCGCDVIQKFVRSSFEHGMPSSSSSAMMQPHHTHPAFHGSNSPSSSNPPYHQATLVSAMMTSTTPFSH